MHGGLQIQIEQTKSALDAIGVQVEYLRWWDGEQRGDVIQFFGRPTTTYINFAHQKGIKVVMLQLLTGLGSRAGWARSLQKVAIKAGKKVSPNMIGGTFKWGCACCPSGRCLHRQHRLGKTFNDRSLWSSTGKNPHRPQRRGGSFFAQPANPARRVAGVYPATIAKRKRVLELAQAAVKAETPLCVVGKPYSENDEYARRFVAFAAQHPKLIRYEGAVNDRQKLAEIYRAARGFVLLSTMETRSLSSEEAAACECPLLLSDLPLAAMCSTNKPLTARPAPRPPPSPRSFADFTTKRPPDPNPPNQNHGSKSPNFSGPFMNRPCAHPDVFPRRRE